MKNLIVVGDSYCMYPEAWPRTLAIELNLNLVCYGDAGQPWWNIRNYITKLSADVINKAEYIVFAHTNAERLPTLNKKIGMIDHSKSPKTEIEQSIHLYYKYIHEQDFLTWAQQQWFIEISRTWGHKKLCHLHCFPWSLSYSNLLKGLNITTNLTAISLNEIGAKNYRIENDFRPNHLNEHNNIQLGLQLAEHLKNYDNKSVSLDTTKFEQKTNFWLERGNNWD